VAPAAGRGPGGQAQGRVHLVDADGVDGGSQLALLAALVQPAHGRANRVVRRRLRALLALLAPVLGLAARVLHDQLVAPELGGLELGRTRP
jgi:hypothetical protein